MRAVGVRGVYCSEKNKAISTDYNVDGVMFDDWYVRDPNRQCKSDEYHCREEQIPSNVLICWLNNNWITVALVFLYEESCTLTVTTKQTS